MVSIPMQQVRERYGGAAERRENGREQERERKSVSWTRTEGTRKE
jgi:hypothetical protein